MRPEIGNEYLVIKDRWYCFGNLIERRTMGAFGIICVLKNSFLYVLTMHLTLWVLRTHMYVHALVRCTRCAAENASRRSVSMVNKYIQLEYFRTRGTVSVWILSLAHKGLKLYKISYFARFIRL